jgi:hypothetical protein
VLFIDDLGTFVASLNRSVEPADAGRLAASAKLELDDQQHEDYADRRRCGENAAPQ